MEPADIPTWSEIARVMPLTLSVLTIIGATVYATLKVIKFALEEFRKRDDDERR